MAATVQLTAEACRALVNDARSQFENGCQELWNSDDESQRPTIEACTEIIGRLERWLTLWPKHETPIGPEHETHVEVEFTPETIAWLDRQRADMEAHVAELDSGSSIGADPGYHAGQVYLLHVLRGISGQREAVAA